MNIYFLGAVSALHKFRKHYEKTVKILESAGHNVISEHILEREPSKPETYPVQYDREYYKIVVGRIRAADAVVADISYPTSNIGYEISFALENEIPVLALQWSKVDQKISPLLIGNPSKFLLVKDYTLKNLPSVLDDGLKEIGLLSAEKFSFVITPQIARFLNWISTTKGLSRSTYLRSLIEKDMRRSMDYKKTLK